MSINSQFVSQQSDDLSMYLPNAVALEDELFCLSVDALTHSIDFNCSYSAHRTDPDIFNPFEDDMEAVSALNIEESYDKNDLNIYLHEPSRVIPHIPRDSSPMSTISSHMSPPSSPLKSKSSNLKDFLVYDEVTGRERRPLLHEFIRLILEQDEYSYMAEYVDRKQGIFKLHRPKDVSELWKHVKGRNSDNKMTYDKLARAIRYYYGSGIMISCPGRFTFRFGPKSGFGTTWWPAY